MVIDDLFLRRAVVFASGLLYWAGVLVHARRVRRHIGRSPNLKPRGPKETLLWLGWFIVILSWIFQPALLKVRAPPESSPSPPSGLGTLDFGLVLSFLNPSTLAAGLALVGAGFAGTLWCYSAMGDSWRIGVDRAEKNALITLGPYRRVRHPIYLFQIILLAGTALLLPTILSLAILLFHLVCVLIKAADEEAYLLTVHGQSYAGYVSRTGRLLPRLSRPQGPHDVY